MMHFSHRQLLLAILPVAIVLVSACGSSGGSDPNAGTDGSAEAVTAVSASPQPGDTADPALKGSGSKVEPVTRPGVEAPLDSTPDRISKHVGTRLFATGFEEGVSLVRPSAALGVDQYLEGGDTPGYNFPITLGSTPSGLASRVFADVGAHRAMTASEYARGSIRTVAGRSGQTRALALHSKSFSQHSQQISLANSGFSGDPVVFQRMWVKFDERTLYRAQALGSSFYQTFWEVKGQGDLWLRLKLQFDAAKGLIWVAKGNGVRGDVHYWSDNLKTAPVVLAPESSAAGWHKVEIWLDPASGRFKVSIDGQTLVDRAGVLFGSGGDWIQDFRMMMVASTVAPLAEVLFDDLEFWDLPPEDAFAPAAN